MTNDTSTQTPPASEATEPTPSMGWTRYAEIVNGRFAMIGFTALIIIELLTHQDLFTWMGLR